MAAATKRAEAALRTRAAVLAAAKTLFERHGYEAVTLRHVAGSAGVSTGAIFAHVKEKAALFEAAIGHPAPDVAAFLLKVFNAPTDAKCELDRIAALTELSQEARRLRMAILGHHA